MRKFIFVLILVLSIKGFSQTTIPPYIEVTGSAEITVEPDIYFINLRIFGAALYGENAQDKKVERELVKLGIKLTDFSLTPISYDIKPAYSQPNDRDQYYEYVLRIQTEKKLLDIFKALSVAGVEQLFVSNVDYTKKTDVAKELGITAIRNAADKARIILGSLNKTNAQILSITEEPSIPQIFIDRSPSPYNGVQKQNNNYGHDKAVFQTGNTSIQYKIVYHVKYSII